MKKIIFPFLFICCMIFTTSCNDDGITGIYDDRNDLPKEIEKPPKEEPKLEIPSSSTNPNADNSPPKKRTKSRLKELIDSDPVYRKVIDILEEMDGGIKSTYEYDN